MPNKIRGLALGPLWIITCYLNNRMEVLTIDPDGDGGYVPVFSFKEEAQTFVRLSEDAQEMRRGRWRSRQTTAGELVSVLVAPCAQVRQVTLDPLPLSLGRAMPPFFSVARERFIEDLMGGTQGAGGRASAFLGAGCFYSPSCREGKFPETSCRFFGFSETQRV